MSHALRWILASFCLVLASLPCAAQEDETAPGVTIIGPGTLVTRSYAGGTINAWTIAVTVPSGGGGSTTIRLSPGVDGQNINVLAIRNSGTNITAVEILRVLDAGGNPVRTFGRIDEIPWDGASNNGPVIIQALQTLGNVGVTNGTIGVSAIVQSTPDTVVIRGDLKSSIVLQQAPGNPYGTPTIDMSVHGNILGNIQNQYGGLRRVESVNGSIGASSTPVNIWTRDDIQRVRAAAGAIYANIEAGKYAGGSTTDLGLIESRDGITGSVKGRQFSTFTTYAPDPGLFINGSTGDLTASLTLAQALNKPVRIGRSLLGNISIGSSTGLTDQVIINQQNVAGAWSGTITIGGTTLSPTPSYSNLASAIGGGAAGLAKFGLHGESSAPVNGSTFTYTPAGCPNSAILCNTISPGGAGLIGDNRDRWALIRHYGPVSLPSGGTGAVTVERRPYGGSTWTDVSSNYVADVYTSGAGSDAGSRVLRVKSTSSACADEYFALNYDYRIKPVAGKVKCANVAGTPDVDAYTYTFTLLADCDAGLRAYYDTTGDGRLTSADLVGWLAARRDYDRNGVADTADLARLMEAVAGSPD